MVQAIVGGGAAAGYDSEQRLYYDDTNKEWFKQVTYDNADSTAAATVVWHDAATGAVGVPTGTPTPEKKVKTTRLVVAAGGSGNIPATAISVVFANTSGGKQAMSVGGDSIPANIETLTYGTGDTILSEGLAYDAGAAGSMFISYEEFV